MQPKNWLCLVIILMLLASCNLPTGSETPQASNTEESSVDIISTAVELTTVAKLTELAASSVSTSTQAPPSQPTETAETTPSPTLCTPQVTANTAANVRSGPGTVYDVVGSLAQGQSATVAGRNDANTWFYIEYSGATGGRAWISGTVVTAACLPTNVQIIAAPPTPQPTATEKVSPPPASGAPDLVAYAWQWSPDPGKKDQNLFVMVSVTNNGTAAAGQFTVSWLSNQTMPGCNWTVNGLAVGERRDLECTFVYTSAQYPANSNVFYIAFIVDPDNQVAELDEGNNKKEAQLTVTK